MGTAERVSGRYGKLPLGPVRQARFTHPQTGKLPLRPEHLVQGES